MPASAMMKQGWFAPTVRRPIVTVCKSVMVCDVAGELSYRADEPLGDGAVGPGDQMHPVIRDGPVPEIDCVTEIDIAHASVAVEAGIDRGSQPALLRDMR